MALLTIAELKQHLETDLPDTALQRLLDAAEQRILDVAGADPGSTVTHRYEFLGYPSGQVRRIWLPRRATSIVQIDERDHPDDSPLTLSANDYNLVDGIQVTRLREGDNPRLFWAPYTDVSFSPVDDTVVRKAVQVDLCKLALNYSGFSTEKIGDVSFSHPNLADASMAAMAPLRSSRARFPIR